MDDLLASLSPQLLRLVESTLCNDESSSDADMVSYFVGCGLTQDQATRALSYRSSYLVNLFLEGHTPIRKGDQAIRFNPDTSRFEPLKR
jgi:hypothetical protein